MMQQGGDSVNRGARTTRQHDRLCGAQDYLARSWLSQLVGQCCCCTRYAELFVVKFIVVCHHEPHRPQDTLIVSGCAPCLVLWAFSE